jgi:hypothetical protein
MLKKFIAALGLTLALPAQAQTTVTCAGTNAVITSVGRNFFVVNGGATLNDHVWYTRSTTFSFVGVPAVFPSTGELMDFVGITYPATGCYASSITIKAAPSLSCTPPASARPSAGKGVVTAVGPNYVIIGATYVNFAPCTKMNYGGNATAPAVGDAAEWEGYTESNGNVMGQTLSFN